MLGSDRRDCVDAAELRTQRVCAERRPPPRQLLSPEASGWHGSKTSQRTRASAEAYRFVLDVDGGERRELDRRYMHGARSGRCRVFRAASSPVNRRPRAADVGRARRAGKRAVGDDHRGARAGNRNFLAASVPCAPRCCDNTHGVHVRGCLPVTLLRSAASRVDASADQRRCACRAAAGCTSSRAVITSGWSPAMSYWPIRRSPSIAPRIV